MSADRFQTLHIPLGSTDPAVHSDGTYAKTELEGAEYLVADQHPASAVISENGLVYPNGLLKKVRVVRNVSGGTLLPGMIVKFGDDEGEWGKRVVGYTSNANEKGYPVDDLLSVGVPDGHLFYIVVSGPATVIGDKISGVSEIKPGDPISTVAAVGGTGLEHGVGCVNKRSGTFTVSNDDYSDVIAAVENTIGVALEAMESGVKGGKLRILVNGGII